MVSRKRARAEVEVEENGIPESSAASSSSPESGVLHQLRNMWEFANLMQYIFTFGKIVKINDSIEIDDLETECLKPGPSETLLEIGLSLLKFVSSHRGITPENFEEYARRQYYAKAPSRNPFGDDELPVKFNEFDLFQKIRVLQQLSVWTLWNPDRIREKMPEQKENELVQWRVEELGYDRDDRLYYVLDDNRLYRRTEPAIPPPQAPKPKANSKRGRALARAERKRKAEAMANGEDADQASETNQEEEDDPSKNYKWECIAVTLADYRAFVNSIRKTKDPNEKVLRDSLVNNVIPVIEQIEEARQRKIQRRERELINLQKMANAKRSGRLAEKQERERQAKEEAEEKRRLDQERETARRKEEVREKIEKERLYRLMTREQRLKDREEKRKQHEEQLATIVEQARQVEGGSDARLSERHLKAEMAKHQKELHALQPDEDQWFFDCSGCGVHGENLDDGSHSVACERCNVWQHSECLGIRQDEAEREDFHFICKDCQRRIEEAKRPKLPPLKFRLSAPTASSPQPTTNGAGPNAKKPKIHHRDGSQAHTSPHTVNGAFPQVVIPGPPSARPQPAQSWFKTPSAVLYQHPLNVNGSPPMTHAAPPVQPEPPKSPLQFIQHYPPAPPPGPTESTNAGSPYRPPPSSSTSAARPASSPIQNRPSMSPTQGNRDVGPLAGFPSSSQPNRSIPSTPFSGSHQRNISNAGSPYPVGPTPNQSQSSSVSFSSTTSQQLPTSSFRHTPPPPPSNGFSPTIPKSGLSPTKHSPTRSFGSMGITSVLPPVQKLQPSPKLLTRSSPDAPIPPPVKSMTPEQEDRRRRENMLAAQQLIQQQQQQQGINPADAPVQPREHEQQRIVEPPSISH